MIDQIFMTTAKVAGIVIMAAGGLLVLYLMFRLAATFVFLVKMSSKSAGNRGRTANDDRKKQSRETRRILREMGGSKGCCFEEKPNVWNKRHKNTKEQDRSADNSKRDNNSEDS